MIRIPGTYHKHTTNTKAYPHASCRKLPLTVHTARAVGNNQHPILLFFMRLAYCTLLPIVTSFHLMTLYDYDPHDIAALQCTSLLHILIFVLKLSLFLRCLLFLTSVSLSAYPLPFKFFSTNLFVDLFHISFVHSDIGVMVSIRMHRFLVAPTFSLLPPT